MGIRPNKRVMATVWNIPSINDATVVLASSEKLAYFQTLWYNLKSQKTKTQTNAYNGINLSHAAKYSCGICVYLQSNRIQSAARYAPDDTTISYSAKKNRCHMKIFKWRTILLVDWNVILLSHISSPHKTNSCFLREARSRSSPKNLLAFCNLCLYNRIFLARQSADDDYSSPANSTSL